MKPSYYDERIDPEAVRILISGEKIPVMEYTVRLISEKGRVGLDGGVYPGPYKDQSLLIPLYKSAETAITQIVEDWAIRNVERIAPDVFKYPYRVGLFSLITSMGLSDGGTPYLDSKFDIQSEHGKRFTQSPEGERARLMCLQMAGKFIESLGKEVCP